MITRTQPSGVSVVSSSFTLDSAKVQVQKWWPQAHSLIIRAMMSRNNITSPSYHTKLAKVLSSATVAVTSV